MAKMTIYVPDATKARMDRVREDVNWSALAVGVFESELGRIAARKEKKNMADVIQRLRASNRASMTELQSEGFAAGEQWAKDSAEAIELKRLRNEADAMMSSSQIAPTEMFSVGQSAFSAAEHFVFTIRPEHDGDRIEAASFWDDEVEVSCQSYHESEYVGGFVEGALSVWAEVADKL